MRSYPRLHRRATRWLSGWLAVALLFMQLAVSAYACPMAQGTARVMGTNEVATNVMPDCAGNSPLAMDPAQPLLCQAHCQHGAQAAQPTPALDAPASPLLLAVLDWSAACALPGLLPQPALRASALSAGAPPPGSPPLYLALLVLRN